MRNKKLKSNGARHDHLRLELSKNSSVPPIFETKRDDFHTSSAHPQDSDMQGSSRPGKEQNAHARNEARCERITRAQTTNEARSDSARIELSRERSRQHDCEKGRNGRYTPPPHSHQ